VISSSCTFLFQSIIWRRCHYRDCIKSKIRQLTNMEHYVGSEVLTAAVTKSSIFWDITPCSPLKVYRCFRGICRLHLQSLRISQARNQHGKCKQSASSAYSLTLKMDTTCSSETSITFNRLHSVILQKIEILIAS
jgi:hypothetical protein